MPGTRNKRAIADEQAPAPPKRAPSQTESGESPLADLDTQLMLQVRDGQRDAASALIRRNHTRIARYIARLVRDRRSVEDLTQDVFLQALSHADQYRPTAKVSTWLYRIATNAALNHLKRPSIRRRVSEPPEGTLEVADRHEAAPDRQLSLDELKHQVSRAILRLPINQRVALTLFQYEECSYEQIASVLDVSVEAVRSLLMRARTTLRRELNGLV